MTFVLRTPSLGSAPIMGPSYLRMFISGNWTAYLETFGLTKAIEGEPATLTIEPEQREGDKPIPPDVFTGTVRRSREVPGSETVVTTIVGGKGHMPDTFPAPFVPDMIQGSTVLPAGLILRKIADAVGETLAPGVEQALDAWTLPRWHVAGGTTVRDAIDMLVYDVATTNGVDLGWRFLSDGTIWAGIETWPTATGTFTYTDQDPDDGRMIYAPSGAPIRPGTTVQGERAVEVEYHLASPALRAHVRHAVKGDPPLTPDSSASSLYLASYAARVAVQRDDGTLDVVCDDARMGSLLAVPFRLGIPGAKVTFPAGGEGVGARVRVRFENGSPRGAYACDVEQDATATHAFALVGDSCGYLLVTSTAPSTPAVVAISPVMVPGAVPISILGPGHKWARGVSG